jgi:AbrB family looped-hinge helix DNA binding protein
MILKKLTVKGHVTIPIAIRDELGLKPGDRVLFVRENGRIVVRWMPPLSEQRGSIPGIRHVSLELVRREVRRRIGKGRRNPGKP